MSMSAGAIGPIERRPGINKAATGFHREELRVKKIMIGVAAGLLALVAAGAAMAQDIKVGAVLSMTGPFNTNGRDVLAGAQLYLQQHGDTVAGKPLKIIVKDDASKPDVARRLAQELIVNDKVGLLMVGISPAALSIASLSTEAKIATVVAISGTSVVVERSPYMVRTSFTLGQSSAVIADWAVKNGAKKIVTLVADFAPGAEAETAFKDVATKAGAQVVASLRVPLDNADFAPFLQRARDLNPDTLFAFVPNHQASPLVKQFLERGMDKSGIRFVATGDLTPDDDLPNMTDAMLGVVTAHHYSAAHDSALNKEFVAAYEKANGHRPTFHSVSGYDAMHLIMEALKKTGGNTSGDALVAAMKGMKWESPRGPMSIDPETRDVVHNEYIRKVEKVNGEMYNVEFATIDAVKDPLHGAKK
jgi:branched-chain amino acid transport system substrate-binding protein